MITSKEIRERGRFGMGPGAFQRFALEILADIVQRFEQQESAKQGAPTKAVKVKQIDEQPDTARE